MTASTLFIVFSLLAISTSLVWALVQIATEPGRSFRIASPIAIAAFSVLALLSGIIARNQQAETLMALQPRSISAEQRSDLRSKITKNTPPIRIVYRLMDGEGKDFSEQLASAIGQAGGTVLSIVGNSLGDLQGRVSVAVNAGEHETQEAASRLCDALTAAKILCGGELAPGSLAGPPGRGEILLVVGRK